MARAIAAGSTGEQLRSARQKADLSAAAVAAQMGVTHQRVFNLEAMRSVSLAAASRYLAALSAAVVARDGRSNPLDAMIMALGQARDEAIE